MAKLWRRRWQRTPPPSNALAVLINRFMCVGSLPHSTWSVRPRQGARGRGGKRRVNPNRRGTMLSASWEAVMSRAGEINRFHKVGFPGLLSLLPSRGSPAAAALLWWCRLGGGDPNNVPCCPKRGATAVANAMAFFARMDTFVHWRGEGCGNNDGGDVIALAACKCRQWRARREQEGGV